jgi:anthranilate synthase component 2|tara:strand:+ start:9429 stop:9992 length:564 start_codon:yes stop_codon:yes gene_type:complete
MLLVIDNYDSFTYNLVQYFGALGIEQRVYRNDKITVEEAQALNPSRILISPGPCTPNEAGVSIPMIEAFAGKAPILGVCLGHQSIGQHFGGKVVRASRLMHGKTSKLKHNAQGLFEGIPQNIEIARYHSLLLERETFPDCLEISAETEAGEIMACHHKELPVWGLQFHPESIATQNGMDLLKNFLTF